ncbi:hypothetical protein HYALB_00005182 [Hymenoscyphus albidus]|uniref:Uncharacterized protein n=1 Tax=Hymenoscyphus albidus TaxID=595503 RepID=A0A9N9Q9F5_9HELO|nr:hypothetical protein HYALB_00005182 [Hymenoscyphus albidus]
MRVHGGLPPRKTFLGRAVSALGDSSSSEAASGQEEEHILKAEASNDLTSQLLALAPLRTDPGHTAKHSTAQRVRCLTARARMNG